MLEDDDDSLILKSAAAERVRLVRANFEHLLDLKRGKYSPRFCELTVCPKTDSIIAQPQRRASPMRETSRAATPAAQNRSAHPGGSTAP